MTYQDQETTTGVGEIWWPPDFKPDSPDVPIDVVIPALDEEKSLPLVLGEIPSDWVRRVVVVDNGSADRTPEVAREGGADVVREPQKGYGAACLAGLGSLAEQPPEIVVFMDADYSDHPRQLPRLVQPILQRDAEFVIGSRAVGAREPGALLPQARFGNLLACTLLELLYNYRYTDLGPFRAIRWEALDSLDMADEDFGWTVEMQVKAAKQGLQVLEVPVSYRRRVGVSKVTGTLKGTVLAGYKILWTIFAELGAEETP